MDMKTFHAWLLMYKLIDFPGVDVKDAKKMQYRQTPAHRVVSLSCCLPAKPPKPAALAHFLLESIQVQSATDWVDCAAEA